MSRLVEIERVHIVGNKESCCFDIKYLQSKRKGILDVLMRKAFYLTKPEELKVFVIKESRVAGYLNQSYPSKPDSREKVISEREVSMEWLLKQFKKYE